MNDILKQTAEINSKITLEQFLEKVIESREESKKEKEPK